MIYIPFWLKCLALFAFRLHFLVFVKIKMNWRFLVAATILFAWGIDLPEARGGRKKGKAPKAGKFQRAVVAVSSGALKGWVQAAPVSFCWGGTWVPNLSGRAAFAIFALRAAACGLGVFCI